MNGDRIRQAADEAGFDVHIAATAECRGLFFVPRLGYGLVEAERRLDVDLQLGLVDQGVLMQRLLDN